VEEDDEEEGGQKFRHGSSIIERRAKEKQPKVIVTSNRKSGETKFRPDLYRTMSGPVPSSNIYKSGTGDGHQKIGWQNANTLRKRKSVLEIGAFSRTIVVINSFPSDSIGSEFRKSRGASLLGNDREKKPKESVKEEVQKDVFIKDDESLKIDSMVDNDSLTDQTIITLEDLNCNNS